MNSEKGGVGGQEIAASFLAAWKVCDKVLPLILTFSSMEGVDYSAVIPAKAGIQWLQELRDPRLRGDDGK